MFNNLLVPVDLGDKSKSAIIKAIQIAHQFNSHVIILNVREEFMNTEEMEMARVSIQELKEKFRSIALDAKTEIKKIIKTLHAEDIDLEVILREGKASEEIINASNELNADMIIMGTNGRDSIQDIILGSTAENVIKASKYPILVIPS